MITLLKSLHAIAAARSDGLLPEFLGPVSGGRIVPCRVVQVATLVAVLPGRSACHGWPADQRIIDDVRCYWAPGHTR